LKVVHFHAGVPSTIVGYIREVLNVIPRAITLMLERTQKQTL
jgi:hypothetical protein